MIGGNGDTVFARLCAAMGQPELASDPRFATHTARGERQGELDALIGQWTAQHTVEELEALMIAHSVPAGRVYTGREMLADPHFAEREALVSVPHPELGEVTMQAPMPRLSANPSAIRRAAPRTVGADNAEVYGALGFDQERLADMATRGVI